MEKFTKSEWGVFDKEPCKFGNAKVNNVVKMPFTKPTKHNGTMYLTIGGFDSETQKEEIEANAHLIASAPEMYSMLKNIEKMIIKSKNEIELADDVVSISHDLNLLLAKARGE